MDFSDIPSTEKIKIIAECEELIDNDQRDEIFSRYPDFADQIIEQISGVQWSRGKSFALADEEGNWFETSDTHQRWITYRDFLHRKSHASDADWERITRIIDETTSRTLNYFEDPSAGNFQKKVKGVVVGHVQSGKTANFTGLLAKAADAGYNLIVVLAGITNILRNQTQKRLLEDLSLDSRIIRQSNADYGITRDPNWIPLTQGDYEHREKMLSMDFGGSPYRENNLPFGGDIGRLLEQNLPMLAIVKKRVDRLGHLEQWLLQCPQSLKPSLKILIIDDEADSASINNQRPVAPDSSSIEVDPDDVDDAESTAINRHIRTILHNMPNTAYVGYTATPYASLLSDPLDDSAEIGRSLYPRDFVLTLPKPDNHDGNFEFFDEEGPFRRQIMTISEEEATHSSDPPPMPDDLDYTLPRQLQFSIQDFFITGAIKEMRGFVDFHHSMLVHTSIRMTPHDRLKKRIRNLCIVWKREYLASDWGEDGQIKRTEVYHQFKDRWKTEFSITAEDEIDSAMKLFLNRFNPQTMVRKINSAPHDSDELIPTTNKLDYDAEPRGLKVIAVGGTILSRGLTVEGLTISYFTRETALYDSLSQMARWCGFHYEYRDLIRVRTTEIIREWFEWIHEVESSLRRDIERYDGDPDLSPLDLAPRVLKHMSTFPGMRTMEPTRRTAMWTAEEYSRGLNGTYRETKRFYLDDQHKLQENIVSLNKMVEDIQDLKAATHIEDGAKGSLLWTQVPFDMVDFFLSTYNSPIEDTGFRYPSEIRPYIERRGSELDHWSVALINNSQSDLSKEKILTGAGISQSFGLIERGRHANGRIDQLVSKSHTAIDLDGYPESYRQGDVRGIAMQTRLETQPLLLIYILHKNGRTRSNRAPYSLFEGISESNREHAVALGIALPDSPSVTQDEATDYYHARGIRPE